MSSRLSGRLAIKLLRRTALYAFAALGFATAVPWIATSLLTRNAGQPDPDGSVTQSSPDERFEAATATFAGGGGISPYCVKTVSILPAGPPAPGVSRVAYEVLSAPCDSFSPVDGVIASSPRVEWLSASRLRITFGIKSTRLSPVEVKLKGRDASGTIAVEFVAHE